MVDRSRHKGGRGWGEKGGGGVKEESVLTLTDSTLSSVSSSACWGWNRDPSPAPAPLLDPTRACSSQISFIRLFASKILSTSACLLL